MIEPAIPPVLHQWSERTHHGLTIRGFTTGDTGKALIHFLHGTGLCGLSYWPMLQPLTQYYDVVITDIQGHGDSDIGDRFLGWNKNAAMVANILNKHVQQRRPRPVYGLGHSLGAVLSTLIAAKHPNYFNKMVLLDPVYFSRGMLAAMTGLHLSGLLATLSPLSRQVRKRRTSWPTRKLAEASLSGRGVYRNWDSQALHHFVQYGITRDPDGQFSLKCPAWLEAKFFGSYPQGLWRSIEAISCPTTLMMADDTYPFSHKTADKAVRINSNITAMRVFGDHCFMQEQPELTAQRVIALFDSD